MGPSGGLRAGTFVVLCMVAAACGDDGGSACDGGACNDAGTRACTSDDQCESGECTLGVCVGPDGGCLGENCMGHECTDDDQCPNGYCVDGFCTGIAECSDDDDCDEGVCDDGICLDPTCDDHVKNGTETAVDCGGDACGACLGDACSDDDGCESGTCIRKLCAPSTCTDSKKNADETDEDCGGPACARCADHKACEEGSDCESKKCIDDECAPPSCDDDIKNGAETDKDCGGDEGCAQCKRGDGCKVDDDCATDHCADTCVIAPTAGFELSTLTPDRGDKVVATSTASEGDADLDVIEYDWGDGDGFETASSHQYEDAGAHTVKQRVTDENGLSATEELELMVSTFRAVRLSETDKSPHVLIDDDGLIATQINHLAFDGGVRSDTSIAPGSGAFYFESRRLGHQGYYGFGVATAAADLTQPLGSDTQSFAIDTLGHAQYNGATEGLPASEYIGFVVDYRGANPVVYSINSEEMSPGVFVSVVRRSQTMNVTTPVFAVYAGTCENQGPAASFNFGSDTTNHPFEYDPVQALTTAGNTALAGALVMGFGQTRARPVSMAPDLDAPGDMSVAAGDEVNLTATAIDDEDGDLTAKIHWVNLATSMFDREEGTGESFTFTAPEVGRYPIEVTVKDSFKVISRHVVMIEATGELPQFDPVHLVKDEYTGDGISLSSDGLQAVYSVGGKMGVRANQPNYGRFWYFEQHRLIDPAENLGGGLTILRGSLNPMHFESMHPSAQINFQGSLWWDLVHEYGLNPDERYYGWAVDYRGVHPIIYVIQNNEMVYQMTLDDVWVPLYPQLYGDPTANEAPFDNEINFGATPFHNNPVMALTNAGVSTAGFEVGWGDANVP